MFTTAVGPARFRIRMVLLIALGAVLVASVSAASAADQGSDDETADSAAAPPLVDAAAELKTAPAVAKESRWAHFGWKGLELGSADEAFDVRASFRSQLRFSSPFRSSPRTASQFDRADENDFRFRRARFKMGGRLLAPWIKFKYEHDLVKGRLLDLRFDIGPEWMKLRVGQWKVDYSRERMDSSGNQQFTERSIVNRAFTLDRQKGVTVLGRLAKGSTADSQYFVGVFTGQGRGVFRERRVPSDAADGSPLWLARYQWNPLGGGVGLSQSDLEKLDHPRLSIALATAGNRSSYTRFSSGGGGRLDGFERGAPGQYSIRQHLEETAFKHRGFSLQHEFHVKRIFDHVNLRRTRMRGSYLTSGYFFHESYPKIPRQLELGLRYAFVDPNIRRDGDMIREAGVVANWFFSGHADKLTADVSRYTLPTPDDGSRRSAVGVRVQWDVSF